MGLSYKVVATFMDSVKAPASFRKLAAMHRWSTENPPATISLRSILERHQNPHKVEQRFLFYNTFLLPEVKIPIGTFVGALVNPVLGPVLGRALDELGITKNMV